MPTKTKSQVGAVVRLKSGGPLMTITATLLGTSKVTCTYYDARTAEFKELTTTHHCLIAAPHPPVRKQYGRNTET